MDLREYPKVSAEKLANLFVSKPTRFAWLTLPKKDEPGAFYYFGRKVGVKIKLLSLFSNDHSLDNSASSQCRFMPVSVPARAVRNTNRNKPR